MAITVWNHVTVRMISIFVILLKVVSADMDTQVYYFKSVSINIS